MGRLHHTKSRGGCLRCKTRKVKCDESRPKCSACAKHKVICEYILATSRTAGQEALRSTQANVPAATGVSRNALNFSSAGDEDDDKNLDPKLELRLMHEWTSNTCKTFSPCVEYWQVQAPLIALEYRHALDALLSLAALDASRKPATKWMSVDGNTVPIKNPVYSSSHPKSGVVGDWKDLPDNWRPADNRPSAAASSFANGGDGGGAHQQPVQERNFEMLTASRMYLDRAVRGQRHALADLTRENIEAAFLTSVLVSFCALFTLSESEEDGVLPTQDPMRWLHLARGIHYVSNRWRQMIGKAWMIQAGLFYGSPDLSDADELFDLAHCRPFGRLLTWGQDFEAMTVEDRSAYQMALSYVGLIYKSVRNGQEDPLSTCRRFIAMPPRCPPVFVDLVEAKQPRALTILAHFLAIMKFADDKVPWLRGIAERQVPKIYDQLPVGWREMMAWPMAVTHGDLEREPTETQVDDVTSL